MISVKGDFTGMFFSCCKISGITALCILGGYLSSSPLLVMGGNGRNTVHKSHRLSYNY